MNYVRQNLIYFIAKLKTNPTQLSEATGVPQPTIHRILAGESKDPRTETLKPLADFFGVTTAYLRDVDAESEDAWSEQAIAEGLPPELELEDGPRLRRPKRIPVVGTVEGGPDGYLEEFGYPTGHGEGDVEHAAKGPHAYALRVRGESMHPRIRAGEFVVVEPDIAAAPGDDVVVICRDGRKMVKQFLYQRENHITLGSINNGYKPVTLPLADIEAIHKVAAILSHGAFNPAH